MDRKNTVSNTDALIPLDRRNTGANDPGSFSERNDDDMICSRMKCWVEGINVTPRKQECVHIDDIQILLQDYRIIGSMPRASARLTYTRPPRFVY